MGLLRAFWEVFWKVFGIFYMAVGALAILNGARLYWLSRRTVSTEAIELQSLCRHWLWKGVSFFVIGFSGYTSAPFTAALFSQPIALFGVAVTLIYLMYWWFHKRLKQSRATNRED